MTGRAPACNCSPVGSATDDTTGYEILAIVAMSYRRRCPVLVGRLDAPGLVLRPGPIRRSALWSRTCPTPPALVHHCPGPFP